MSQYTSTDKTPYKLYLIWGLGLVYRIDGYVFVYMLCVKLTEILTANSINHLGSINFLCLANLGLHPAFFCLFSWLSAWDFGMHGDRGVRAFKIHIFVDKTTSCIPPSGFTWYTFIWGSSWFVPKISLNQECRLLSPIWVENLKNRQYFTVYPLRDDLCLLWSPTFCKNEVAIILILYSYSKNFPVVVNRISQQKWVNLAFSRLKKHKL